MSFLSTLLCVQHGDVEVNPGPNGERYTLAPRLFAGSYATFGLPPPTVDLFADSETFLFTPYVTAETDALSLDWRHFSGVCWANPPFFLLPAVFSKLAAAPCFLLLVVPEYDRLSVALGTTLAACFTVLPAGPTYLDPSKKLLPAPPWRTLVFLFLRPDFLLHWRRLVALFT